MVIDLAFTGYNLINYGGGWPEIITAHYSKRCERIEKSVNIINKSQIYSTIYSVYHIEQGI